jgi:RNase P/RNase MRP subunit POP5
MAEQAKTPFKKLVNKFIKKEVLEFISKGISPVKQRTARLKNTGNKQRYVAYSKSYQDQIKNLVAFRTMPNGAVMAVEEALTSKELKQYRASKQAKRDNKDQKALIAELNAYTSKNGKKIRPVNLEVSGGLRRSLKKRITKNGVKLWFSSPLAKYHNEMGAGKPQVIRRLLPNFKGEQFANKIEKKIVEALYKALKLSK